MMRKDYEEEERREKKRKSSESKSVSAEKKRKKGNWSNILTIVLMIIFILLVGVYAVLNHYYGKSNFVKDSEISINQDAEAESTGLSDDEAEALQSEAYEATKDFTLPNNSNVYNILLIGVDRRDKTWYGNSDSMILVSINKETGKFIMTSFMRDLYAMIPDVGVKKLNAACAYGGGPLLVRTIEENYKIPIDNYASVDFDAMIDIVDLVGGVDVEISEEEARVANGYIDEMCRLRNVDSSGHHYSGSGLCHMDGYQAVAYARIRYVGNADYQRTERQRIVLSKILEKATTLSVAELNTMVESILPKVTHNLDQSTLLNLIGELPTILSYERETSRVPYDGMFTTKGEMLVPDFAATIEKLQSDIYGTGQE
ncbi:MAG: LCP family protein [Fusicatenibacter sp.]|nr:LCP family protein [Lachnospiraceae bacterium]MDY2938191.1 LCP family protein [Fusicatenibacter sp.]